MSDPSRHPPPIDFESWINQDHIDRFVRDQRQVISIIINAIGIMPKFKEQLVFKGGALLAIAHGSPRLTSDLDFTAQTENPDEFAEIFVDEMNKGLERARTRLGYVQWRCRVQGRLKLQPRNFSENRFPALGARIAYARIGSKDEQHLNAGNCANVIDVEVSFREPVIETEEIQLIASNGVIRAYSINEVIAEKLRAFLQQEIRNRRRRQDIFDIAYILDRRGDNGIDGATVLRALLEKCASRDVPVNRGMIDNQALIDRAKSEWDTMALEVNDLPSFEDCFGTVREFYLNLPWEGSEG